MRLQLFCSRCHTEEPIPGQAYCQPCRVQAQREYRERRRTELETLRNERKARLRAERQTERALQ